MEEELCSRCEKNPAQPLHDCPYALDIGDEYRLPEDERKKCDCCEDCECDCAMDI